MQIFLRQIQDNLILVLCFLLGAVLLFANLGDLPFWCDEAMTANVARNISQSIVPRGWDGVNIFVPREVVDNNFLVTLLPWLQDYLVFISFKLFGESNFTARLPFALFGLLSIPLLYKFAKWFVGKDVANLATIIFIFSVTFLVYSRNCRYYSLTLFFGLLLVYAYFRLDHFKSWYNFWFIVAGILLFHSSYLVFAALYITILFFFLIWERDKTKLKTLFVSSWIIGAFTLPWFFLTDRVVLKEFFEDRFLLNTGYLLIKNIKAFIGYGFFSLVLVGVFIIFLALPQNKEIWQKYKRAFLLISTVIITYILVSCFLQSYDYQKFPNRLPYIRISLILLPCFAIWNAIGFRAIANYSKLMSYLLLTLFLLTNVFSWPFPVKTQGVPLKIPIARSFLYEYAKQIFDPPQDQAIIEVANHLQNNAKQGDVIFADQCWSYQLVWYFNQKYKFCCQQDFADPDNKDFMKLPDYLDSTFDQPKWIVVCPFTFKASARQHVQNAFDNINMKNYELVGDISKRDFFLRPNFESFFMVGFDDLDLAESEKTYIFKQKENL
ncbi:MAG: glycosyltransferase family 39 protein [Pseudomonadota bacterium]